MSNAAILRKWAKAYRETPEHQFPSDPHAEFFPGDLDDAAAEIERLRARVEVLEAALVTSIVAIDDWLVTYADTECSEESVAKAWKRILSNGGTIAYIAEVQAANRAALRSPPVTPTSPDPSPTADSHDRD